MCGWIVVGLLVYLFVGVCLCMGGCLLFACVCLVVSLSVCLFRCCLRVVDRFCAVGVLFACWFVWLIICFFCLLVCLIVC